MPEPSRPATPSDLRALRDASVRTAKHALDAGDWRAALAALFCAQRYDNQAAAMEGDDPP
jgi:hypothetical protein